jgi:outer membrane protein assembly factor BamD
VRRTLLLFALLLGPAAAGCEPPPPKTGLNYSADAQRAYNSAMEEFNAHNWLDAQQAMREVKRKYAYSRYAPLAELRIADADFEQEKFGDAIRGYKQFVHDHRSLLEEIGYARARIAEAQYKQISESFLLPASEERDQAATLESYKELRSYLHDYPDGKESAKICDLLEDVTVKLVRHELSVARFYLARDNFDATVGRVQYALRNFAADPPCRGTGPATLANGEPSPYRVDFGLAPEALVLLGETYLKMHRWLDARAAFSAVLTRYPESAYVIQAQGYLNFMRTEGV